MEDIKDTQKDNYQRDEHVSYLVKRWDRIAAAMFLVSSHIKDSDQIKWSLRNRALSILSFIHELEGTTIERHLVLEELVSEVELIHSELSLAFAGGLLNSTNFEIISEQILLYKKEVGEYKLKNFPVSPLQREFMKIEKPLAFSTNHEEVYKGQNNTIKDKISAAKKEGIKDIKMVAQEPKDQKYSDRRNKIIELVKNKGMVSIKDISISMKDCSEKTIQRELASLVAEGVLNKKGDRRWSTYSLSPKK